MVTRSVVLVLSLTTSALLVGCSLSAGSGLDTTDDDSAAATTSAEGSEEEPLLVEGTDSTDSDEDPSSRIEAVEETQPTVGTVANDAARTTGNDHDHDHEPPAPLETVPSSIENHRMESAIERPSSGDVWKPSPGLSWQWQLTGSADTSVDAQMYDLDMFDTPNSVISGLKSDGRAVICYFSAGAWEEWRPDASDFDPSLLGESNGWPGERWLDIRKMSDLEPLMEARLDLAVQKGCDGVEPDNVDGYQNGSGFPLTASDQIVFNTFLARAAHERGLSIGLKNAAELVGVLQPSFDFAVVEECVVYDECRAYKPFVDNGKAVFHVEYSGNLGWCGQVAGLGFSSLEKDDDVSAVYRPCP